MWKRIGNYEICWQKNQLRRAAPGHGTWIGRLLKTSVDSYGYIVAKVTIHGKHYEFLHQVVALVFHGPCPVGKEVNHKDTNKRNNNPKNLEYVTDKEHSIHTMTSGLFRLPATAAKGTNNGNAKLTNEKVKMIRELDKLGKPKKDIAKEFQVFSRSNCLCFEWKKLEARKIKKEE